MSYKVIDNFLNNQFYEKLSYDLKGENHPWYYTKIDVDLKKSMNNGLFTHVYYGNHKPTSEFFNLHIGPIIESLDVEALIMVRANCVLRDVDTIETPYHTDNNCLYSTTAILFLTTCNAKTVLKVKGKEIPVDSVENRLLLFDSKIKHKVLYHTDVWKRHVINFNFIRNKNETYPSI
tara:strand:+ start:393 stop:923 length:531 start_codon:yes stop_codon:yes gene_type:complete